ncbi:methylated-DNA--[protein]-cysteine S-methyltransferase [Actinobacteria bacterium YIM 96077]|uniref:Methylated-DNA--protein-cysteine methyltransferase n=1 Tax=Phytoactinopolyspora halophila TaxID=1981511 RepID=A0A329R262_9ACTN|nr:methylated-DNA--[protein]-cysteine S-methyltransferase [Phytoactinopolyspora halophila]AYY12104.1 methylated-DNA--[protein]-cysteine S-methyltransferase [Actinobacteria bacterium YIM 96077]RAW18660.1 methylated-DNA--[protein]-cysteine S-methyltransferase [Phytoactinopolyspora halophila]
MATHDSDDTQAVHDADVAVTCLDTPVGQLSIAVTGTGVASVSWGSPDAPGAHDEPTVAAHDSELAHVITQFTEYLHGSRRHFDLAVDWRYTSGIQHAVLTTLYETVPYGTSVTYGELAARSGHVVPARGVGAVMGSNPLPILVPCHRVVAHDGLGGYSGGTGRNGLEIKRWLLALEGVLPPTLV